MAKIAKQLTELVGNTPLLELKNFSEKRGLQATVIAKLESQIKELEFNIYYHEKRLNEIIDDQNRVNNILKELYVSLDEFKKANPET